MCSTPPCRPGCADPPSGIREPFDQPLDPRAGRFLDSLPDRSDGPPRPGRHGLLLLRQPARAAGLRRLRRSPAGAARRLVWVTSRPGFNFVHYKHQHEPILYAAQHGQAANWYGDHRQVTTLDIASEAGRDYQHPTQKPVELLAVPIANSTRHGEIVLDPFVGSGSTIIAAEQLGRRYYAMDIDPRYAQVTIERWQSFSGSMAARD